ncbi:Oxidoreductase-like protein, N-terminal [Hydrocarboniphaga daqingensis]|jgi:hypothetical protein|uniref:Oxidoreductase-like protein, N-terminal n=2 Tax=Hydrocarboniphaga daqingensis TaxID=490188 RepID=A0A1M5LHU6_9GAMM|nr:Oxidoreductase-like protein, N-terminal [Hydrocarboniphaga daqingensis]
MNDSPMNAAGADDEEPMPPQPDRPDCCNGGCAVCVLDGFDEEMDLWRQACRAVLARRAARQQGAS